MAHEVIVDREAIHRCALPKQGSYAGGEQYHNKTIIACSDCGRYWFLHRYTYDVGGTVYGDWHPIRWYHWRKKWEIEHA